MYVFLKLTFALIFDDIDLFIRCRFSIFLVRL